MQPKEIPLLMAGELVRAVLEGRKTETRRPLKPQPELAIMPDLVRQARTAAMDVGLVPTIGEVPRWCWNGCFFEPWPNAVVPANPFGWYWGSSVRLWVRETWCGGQHGMSYQYRADWPDHDFGPRWRPSIHMPRAACRLVLPLAEVRVERLQDITEEGARAEGCPDVWTFANLWGAIYKNWSMNPWVWVLRWNADEILTGEAAAPGRVA